MSSAEVADLVAAEIGGDWSLSNAHGVDLKKCLVTPVRRVYEDSFKEGSTVELWLVLEELPADGSGYQIVFDESARRFGLATSSRSGRDVFLGLYGNFIETLEAM